MSDQVTLAVISLVTTIVVTGGTVLLAWLSLKEKLTRIEGHTNGLLAAANQRTDVATQALADVATTAVAAATSPPTNGEPKA